MGSITMNSLLISISMIYLVVAKVDNSECPFIKLDSEYIKELCLASCPRENLLYCDTSMIRKNRKVTCVCNRGYEFNRETNMCQDVDECAANTHDCDVYGKCVNLPGTYSCDCEEGFTKMSDTHNMCRAVSSCDKSCGSDRYCKELVHGMGLSHVTFETCLCNMGTKASDIGCLDIDECKKVNCGPLSSCINENKTGYRCECLPGYEKNGKHCVDVNECATTPEGAQLCGAGVRQVCANVEGSYRCECEEGYSRNDEGKCESICVVLPVTLHDDECDLFLLESARTKDPINECEDNPCGSDVICVDKLIGYECQCAKGYSYDRSNKRCQDIDECALHLHDCMYTWASSCTNTLGGYTCECKEGFSGDGHVCTEENQEGCTKQCPDNKHCIISQMRIMDLYYVSHETCLCDLGFKIADNGTCVDVSECLVQKHTCSKHAHCTELSPGYNCTCNPGYHGNGIYCQDVNECAEGTAKCHAEAYCVNKDGDYNCKCRPGFSGNGLVCDLICLNLFFK